MTSNQAPRIIIIGGPPASGKSTLAEWLAREFHLPLLSRDHFKETLMDTLGSPDTDRSHELGAAAYAILALMQQQLIDAGVGAVIESNFQRGISEKDLLPIVPRTRMVAIYCQIEKEVAKERFVERAESGDRHPGHHDTKPEKVEELEESLDTGQYDPLELGIPYLIVDSTNGYKPDEHEILQFIVDKTGV